MTETGFGGGGYVQTLAETPSAPAIEVETSESIVVTLGADSNPSYTEYAIYNETDGVYIDASGNSSATAVWQVRSAWDTISASGLTPSTLYTFRVKARNQDAVETGFGEGASCTTHDQSSLDLPVILTVQKASSTVSAPDFMSGLSPSIRLGGKDLNEFGFHVDRISGLDLPRVVPDEELVPGDHTWHVWDEYFAPKRIVLEGYVHGTSPGDLRLRLAYLKSFLTTFEGTPWRSTAPIWLQRSDLPDRHWVAYYETPSISWRRWGNETSHRALM